MGEPLRQPQYEYLLEITTYRILSNFNTLNIVFVFQCSLWNITLYSLSNNPRSKSYKQGALALTMHVMIERRTNVWSMWERSGRGFATDQLSCLAQPTCTCRTLLLSYIVANNAFFYSCKHCIANTWQKLLCTSLVPLNTLQVLIMGLKLNTRSQLLNILFNHALNQADLLMTVEDAYILLNIESSSEYVPTLWRRRT